jgi:25S rRNA (uracil2634-N3)-methyltransferase
MCTSFDTLPDLRKKYSERAMSHLEFLHKTGVAVAHGVDARHLAGLCGHNNNAFDRIIFNFPHTGQQRVHLNRMLIKRFFESAKPFLKRPYGQVRGRNGSVGVVSR